MTPDQIRTFGQMAVAAAEESALSVFFVFVLGMLIYWAAKIAPEDRRRRMAIEDSMVTQVALSTRAIETSNLVIAQNNKYLERTWSSNERMGERMETLEGSVDELKGGVHDHDQRAIAMAKDVAAVKTILENQ